VITMAKKSGGMFHKVPSGAQPASKGGSAKVISPAGSGSRPGKSAHAIKSSAPEDCYTMGRGTKGALK
jgi:hypothetical protein